MKTEFLSLDLIRLLETKKFALFLEFLIKFKIKINNFLNQYNSLINWNALIALVDKYSP